MLLWLRTRQRRRVRPWVMLKQSRATCQRSAVTIRHGVATRSVGIVPSGYDEVWHGPVMRWLCMGTKSNETSRQSLVE